MIVFIIFRTLCMYFATVIIFGFLFAGEFIHTVSTQSPTRHFVIHSRKALLNGISPADNRKIPPLKYVTQSIDNLDLLMFFFSLFLFLIVKR